MGNFIIAEIKFESPSKGQIYSGHLNHVDIARSYLENGASALSVLTEPHFFKGNIRYIRDIRRAFPHAWILMKDFVLDEVRIRQAKRAGANAVLLIAAFLNDETIQRLYHYAIGLGLAVIVEVHNAEELKSVLKFKPRIIGVNNRNLTTMAVDLAISRQLIQHVPDGTIAICESGIESAEQMNEMSGLGFDGFLVGTSLMSHANPGLALGELLRGIS